MATKGPFDEQTEPSLELASDALSSDAPTERLQLEVLRAFIHASQQARAAERADVEPTLAAPRRRSGTALSDVFRTMDASAAARAQTPGASSTGTPVRDDDARGAEDDATRPVTPVLLEDTSDAAETTSPGLVPVPRTGAEAAEQRRGEVQQLLASIPPFLWSLEGAERWVREHANGDPDGEAYARALGLLARVLSQLQARVDEVQRTLR